jgi:hypothetical protein
LGFFITRATTTIDTTKKAMPTTIKAIAQLGMDLDLFSLVGFVGISERGSKEDNGSGCSFRVGSPLVACENWDTQEAVLGDLQAVVGEHS